MPSFFLLLQYHASNMSSTTMMTITTTPTTQPATAPATPDEESSLSVSVAVAASTIVPVGVDDKPAVVVAENIVLLTDGLSSESVTLTENTMTYCRIYVHSKHSSQHTYVAIN